MLVALALVMGACGDGHPATDAGPGPDARPADAPSDGRAATDGPSDARPGPDGPQVQCPADPSPCEGTCNTRGYCEVDRGHGPEVRIPAATVVLGDTRYAGEVERLERVAKPYYLDKYEVTAREYKRCLDAGACDPPRNGGSGPCTVAVLDDPMWQKWMQENGLEGAHPANCVSWAASGAYCRWKGARLPTEAEWVLAGRGGSSPGACETPADLAMPGKCNRKVYPWGDTFEANRTNTDMGGAAWKPYTTTPVGFYDGSLHRGTMTSYQTADGSSAYGVHDLSGNLREWVSDERPDHGGTSTTLGRVLKADGYATIESMEPLSAWTFQPDPNSSTFILGFRCARDL